MRPFHFGLSVVSANFQMRSMAKRNSKTEEKWIAHVGMERALIGSECITFVCWRYDGMSYEHSMIFHVISP